MIHRNISFRNLQYFSNLILQKPIGKPLIIHWSHIGSLSKEKLPPLAGIQETLASTLVGISATTSSGISNCCLLAPTSASSSERRQPFFLSVKIRKRMTFFFPLKQTLWIQVPPEKILYPPNCTLSAFLAATCIHREIKETIRTQNNIWFKGRPRIQL